MSDLGPLYALERTWKPDQDQASRAFRYRRKGAGGQQEDAGLLPPAPHQRPEQRAASEKF
jgi:hypothetical protein